MENLDIIVLSAITTTVFVVFGIYTYREFKRIDLYGDSNVEMGPRANLVRFMGKLFDESQNKKLDPRQQALIYKSIKRTISDMESDGVYFPIQVKEQLDKKREELECHYSNLPSVMSYISEDDFVSGHS